MHLQQLRNALLADVRHGTERSSLIRSAGATAGMKLGATLLAFGASLLYARALGPHGYGLYAYVIAWAAVITIPAGLGLPQYLVREGARAPEGVSLLRKWADSRILWSGSAAAILMACAFFLPEAAGARWLFVIAAPLPLLNNLASVRRSLLQAHGWVARSQWPVLILSPAIMLAGLASLWTWRGALRPVDVIVAMTAAAIIPYIINGTQLRKAAKDANILGSTTAHIRSALPFMWLSALYLLNSRVDLIMLGSLKGAHAAGIYSVSARAAELVTFFLAAANMVMAPRIARYHQEGRKLLLQRLLTAATRRVLAVSLPVALLFVIFARPLLTHLYGGEFGEGAVALQILSGAQLVNVASGPTGTILNMTGHEKLASVGVGLAVILNLALNAALIPHFGVEGAAIATGASLVTWNALLWWWIRKRLTLRPTALGI